MICCCSGKRQDCLWIREQCAPPPPPGGPARWDGCDPMIDKNAVAGHCLRLLSTRSLVTFLLSHLQVRKLLAKAIDLDQWASQTKQCPLP